MNNSQFLFACEKNQIDNIKSIIHNMTRYDILSSIFQFDSSLSISRALSIACELNYSELAKAITESFITVLYDNFDVDNISDLSFHKKFIKIFQKTLDNAARFDNETVFYYLLSVKQLNDNLGFKMPLLSLTDNTLDCACRGGNINLVRFILTTPIFKDKPNIQHNQNSPLFSALDFKQFNVVDFLLFSPELKTHSQLDLKRALIKAKSIGNDDAISYILNNFITEHNIDNLKNSLNEYSLFPDLVNTLNQFILKYTISNSNKDKEIINKPDFYHAQKINKKI